MASVAVQRQLHDPLAASNRSSAITKSRTSKNKRHLRTNKSYTTPGIWRDQIPKEGLQPLYYPGDDGRPGDEDGNDDGSGVSDIGEEEALDIQQEHQNARNLAWEQTRVVEDVPLDILGITQKLGAVLREAWTTGKHRAALDLIEEANKEIRRLNKYSLDQHRKQAPDKFTVQGSELFAYIDSADGAIRAWEKAHAADQDGRLKAAISLIGAIKEGIPALAAIGLSPKSVLPEHVAERIDHIIKSTSKQDPEIVKAENYLKEDYIRPSSCQAAIAREAEPMIAEFFDVAMNNGNSAASILRKIGRVNDRLVQSNKHAGFKEADHNLPIDLLRVLLQFLNEATGEERARRVQLGKAKTFETLDQVGYGWLCEQTPFPTDISEGEFESKFQEATIAHSWQATQHPLANDPGAQQHVLEEAKSEISGAQIAESSDVDMDMGDEVQNATGLPDMRVQSFRGHGGNDTWPQIDHAALNSDTHLNKSTQWGQVVKIQTISKCQEIMKLQLKEVVIGCRVIFNRGSLKHPVFEMRPGSCLPKGKAKDIAEKFPDLKLESHKETRTAEDMRKGTDIAELVGGTITRFRVRWRKAGGTTGLPLTTYPTRSELCKLLGKAAVDGPGGEREMARKRREDNIRHLEKCLAEGLHPDHDRRITEEEKLQFPWLYASKYEEDSDDE